MKLAPLCRYCGKPIAKRSRVVYLTLKITEYNRNHGDSIVYKEVPEFPKSKAECQKITNRQVISVSWASVHNSETDTTTRPYINKFYDWDGESYIDEFFCNGDHAKRFGYLMARGEHYTTAYADAFRKQHEKAA